jgi:hypothetical protein
MRLTEYVPIEFLSRVDIFYLTFGFAGVVAGKSVVIIALVEYLSRILTKVKRIYIVIGVCILIFISSVVSSYIKDFEVTFSGIITWTGLIAALLIPLTLYIIAKVKRRAGKIG